MSVSTLFLGARVFTGRRYCDALLLEDGQVLVAGTEGEARRAAPTGVERRTLRGTLVLPGLIDPHFHVADATRSREGLDLSAVTSVPALVEAVHRWASDHPLGPIVGRGWDPERSAGRAWPTRRDLDRAVPDRPAVVLHASGHAGVVNSVALETARVGRATPDPAGGRLGRAVDGTPDGRVFESALDDLVGRAEALDLPEPAAFERTLRWASSFGITTLGAMSAGPEEALALRHLAQDGTVRARVRVYLDGRRWEEYFRRASGAEPSPGQHVVVGVKAYVDGAFGTRTAWLSEPYADDPGNSGMPVASEERLRTLLEASARRGLAPALHAIGDRAIERSLEAIERYRPTRGPPARIEHAALTPPTLFGALTRVRPVLVVQPGFVWSDHWLPARLGPSRARWAYAFRSLVDQGLVVAGSSDAPYDAADPWRGIRAAVERTDPDGRSANPSPKERLGVEAAVRLYTVNGGVALGEPTLGRLEPGSPADLVLVEASSLERAVEVGCAAVRETWVAGTRVSPGRGRRRRQKV